MVAPKKQRKKVVKTKRTSQKKKLVKKPVHRIKKIAVKKDSPIELKRDSHNPIIKPINNLYWESKATFNPTALYNDGKVHIIYRAIGNSDNSVLGYAASRDGFRVEDRSSLPIFHSHFVLQNKNKSLPSINYSSGGGWGGGCEDPRITLLSDKVYMLYTAFDGWGSVRIALTSISLDDFINRRWNWKQPVLISPPGVMHKNWVLFPEKINGKFAILHSVSPNIMVDYFDSLDELNGQKFIHSVHNRNAAWSRSDKYVRGAGPAPIKTKYGWLVLYHAIEKNDSNKYKLYAIILDAQDPTKVLYDSNQPILEPDLWYENEGYKSGVVYSCGAIVKEGELFVYYGGADKVSCVATANLDKFLEELAQHHVSKLRGGKIQV